MEAKIKGIVVSETDFSESDKYIEVLTFTHGKVSIFCKNVRKKNSKLQNKTRLFCFSEFEVYAKNEKFSLNDATVIESFFELTTDIVKFALGSYFLQVCAKLCTEPDEKVAKTLIASLYALTKKEKNNNFVKAVFELRIMAETGFKPILDRCYICEKTENIEKPLFDIINGGICCEKCCFSTENTVLITSSVLKAMYHILFCDVKKLFSFSLMENSQNMLSFLAENYLKTQTDYTFKTLEFYKTIGD